MKQLVNSVKINFLVLLIMGFAISAMATFSFAPQAQAENPITSNWDGDSVSGTTALDITGTNDGTMLNGVTIVPGPDGAGDDAFGFSGNNYIDIPSDPSLNVGTSDFSIDLWVRQTGIDYANQQINTMIDKRNPTNGWKGYVIYSQGGYPSLQLNIGGLGSGKYTNFSSSTYINDGQWHHIIFTVDRDDPAGGVFYIDGKRDSITFDPTEYSGSIDNEGTFRIGGRNDSLANWMGDLDRINQYNRVITLEEIQVIAGVEVLGTDLLVAQRTTTDHSRGVGVLLGQGDGTFTHSSLNTRMIVGPIRVADFNGDGLDDFVAAHGNGEVYVGLGDGSGGFAVSDAGFFTQAGDNPANLGAYKIKIADINGDGDLDLVFAVSGWYFGFNVALGDGNGGFERVAIVKGWGGTRSTDVADIDGDGFADVATANAQGSGSFEMFWGNDNTGTNFTRHHVEGNTTNSGVVIVDIDGDEDLDVVTGSWVSGLRVFSNSDVTSTNRNFDTVAIYGNKPANLHFMTDLTGDGSPDAVVTGSDGVANSGSLDVYLNDGSGGFNTAPQSYPLPISYTIGVGEDATYGDFNGDGKKDIAVADGSNKSITILYGDGNGAFEQTLPIDPLKIVDIADPANLPGGFQGTVRIAAGNFDSSSQPPDVVDSDNDGVADEDDNCPGVANPNQEDFDGDGFGDVCDVCMNDPANDADGDGVCGEVDNCPNTPNSDQNNADSDGYGDVCDPCPNDPNNDADNDGLCASEDNCPIVHNPSQSDIDGDSEGDECDICPNDADNDADGDGVCGDVDNCPTIANADQLDSDGDGKGDVCDPCPFDADNDIDGDGVCGDVDNCPNTSNPTQTDSDGDGKGDACDLCPLDADNDIDGDGVCGDVDNCPNTSNPTQTDSDGDGEGDACDLCPLDANNDIDGDGVCGDVDNCPETANADQADRDGDGIGDVCDACPDDPYNDADGDGVCGDVDSCLATPDSEVVNSSGCSIGQQCVIDVDWKNHGKYVSCVSHAAEELLAEGKISEEEKDAIVSAAAKSSVGKHGKKKRKKERKKKRHGSDDDSSGKRHGSDDDSSGRKKGSDDGSSGKKGRDRRG